jgi:hypothetical protein
MDSVLATQFPRLVDNRTGLESLDTYLDRSGTWKIRHPDADRYGAIDN